jgi:hypothetical protein
MYAATTKDEGNAADGRFSTTCSALECRRLKVWVIGLLRNGILLMGLEPRSGAVKGFRPAFVPQGGATCRQV